MDEQQSGVAVDPRPTLVKVDKLRKVYQQEGKELEVLKSVSLDIRAGEVLAIVGSSGAGKSTLLHLMGTLDRPTSGILAVGGVDTATMDGSALARLRNETIGFVFQFHHLLPEFSAVENVMMPGMIRGTSRKTLEARAKELLKTVNLSHRFDHRPSELSGGEQQRVALARSLLMEPKMLLADEPTGNLDTANSEQMHELFFSINERYGTTMVIVTHNEALAEQMPRVVVMADGKVVDDRRGKHADRTTGA